MRRHLIVIRTLSSRDGESDDMRRHLMVIRTFRQPKASDPVDTEKKIWSSASSSKIRCLSIETTLVSPYSSGDDKSDDTWRHFMVICTFRQPEASEPIDTQRPIWSTAFFDEDSMSIDQDYFSLSFAIQRQSSLIACEDASQLSTPCHPETASPMTCGDTSWLSAPFFNWRQASLLTCRDQYSHLLPRQRHDVYRSSLL